MSDPAIHRSDRGLRAGLLAARQHLGVYRSSVAHYLIGLVALILTAPLVAEFDRAMLVESLLMTAVLVSGVIAVGGRRPAMLGATLLIAPALLGRWLEHFSPGLLPASVFMAFTVLFMAYLLYHLLRYILRAPRVDAEVLCAGVATYLTMGIAFGVLFNLVEHLRPGSFTFGAGVADSPAAEGFNAIYYSFITLATVGYGDITPVSPTARMLAIVESIAGTFYMAILVARLVSLYSSQRPVAA